MVKILGGYTYSDNQYIFSEYVDTLYNFQKTIIELIFNSLSSKLNNITLPTKNIIGYLLENKLIEIYKEVNSQNYYLYLLVFMIWI